MQFNELPIMESTKQALANNNLINPTPIQEQAIPLMLAGQDIIGQAQTGTGKTLAFSIPLLEVIDTNNSKIQGLIICPTRELAIQVYKEVVKLLTTNKKITATAIYGGDSITRQFKDLRKNPQIVVGTPGRIIDHMNRRTMDLSHLRMLILDEADEMLKMGFQEDLETILSTTPKERQTALFSATMPNEIKKIARQYQNNPTHIAIASESLTVSNIKEFYYIVNRKDKLNLLIRTLDFHQPKTTIIFANTKREVDEINVFLQNANYSIDGLHGDLKQSQRDYVMSNFRNSKTKILVATDVAARGLDIDDIDLIINFELPFEDELYVHRIGRTGRAGKKGSSISFVGPRDQNKLRKIEKFTKSTITKLEVPTHSQIESKVSENNYTDLVNIINNNQADHSKFISNLLKSGYTENEIISALIDKSLTINKNYQEIELYELASRTKEKAKPRRGQQKMTEVKMNLGKKDNVTPPLIIDFFKKHGNIYARNIGDIKIGPNSTMIEITDNNLSRAYSINNKFINGKPAKISKK